MIEKKSRKGLPPGSEPAEGETGGAVPAAEAGGLSVVGVGASAGGLEAFTQLLRGLPDEPGFAVVFVQHLAPQHDSALPVLLSGATHLPVVHVEEGMPLAANHIYVIPPNAQLSLVGHTLHLGSRPKDHSQYTPIDFFFRSLAEEMQSRAIGVVLSGTAHDGALGVREIKAVGGVTIAQTPETARFDGMPRAAIATDAVDLVLPPEEIGKELMRIARHPDLQHLESGPGAQQLSISEDQLQRIFGLLRLSSGVDFAHYKPSTIKRRLQRRMALGKLSTVDEYLDYLEKNPTEIGRLFHDVLIQVTRFFREPESFEALTKQVIGELLEQRGPDQPVRIWIPGCASGEEAYSVAIALLETMRERSSNASVQIFATDLSEPAIEQARSGCYPPSIAEDVGEARLQRFFTKIDGSYRVSRQVRDMCIFAKQDLTRDPPYSRLDLILCRNVLIYLGAAVQKKLMHAFHYALKPNGFLMLGGAETIGLHSNLFAEVDKKHRLYRKKLVETPSHFQFPPGHYDPGALKSARSPAATRGAGDARSAASRLLLDRYAPPGVVIDSNLQILEFRGQTDRYLAPAAGEASLNLLKMAREGLAYGLRTALHEAKKNDAPARKEGLLVKFDSQSATVNVEVVPLGVSTEPRHYLVVFEEPAAAKSPPPKRPSPARGAYDDQQRVERLEHELTANREHLQSIIHDLEAANEELQSANEEVLSSNEELQSTNEELDTAKEELQSTNEELNTVNEELHGRNDELGRVNGDLLNLLASVEIAIVIVSGELRIRRFTPMAEKVLNLIPGDVGRPIGQIKPNIHCPELERLIGEVIDRVTVEQRHVQDAQGRWYSLWIRPYKNVENRIDGAVLSLFDVDVLRRHEEELSRARDYAEAIIDTLREPLLVLDGELRVKVANRAFCQGFQVDAGETAGRFIYDLGDGQWDIPELRKLLKEIVPENSRFDGYRVEHEFPEIGRKVMLLNARRIDAADGRPNLVLLAIEDVTPRAS